MAAANKDERSDTQKKTFTRWINYILKKSGRSFIVRDVIVDLQDGTVLLALLEVITGKKLRQEKGRMRVHKINNVNRVLDVLQGYDTKLVNIRSEEIVDGNVKLILGLIWSIVLQFQIKTAMNQNLSGSNENNNELEKILQNWCRQCTQRYQEVDIRNFTTSWRDGLAFNALLHQQRPDLFDFHSRVGKSANDNLQHAFTIAKNDFGIAPLLDPEEHLWKTASEKRYVVNVKVDMETKKSWKKVYCKFLDVNTDQPDKKSILMYITTMYEVLGGQKDFVADGDGSEIEQQGARSDSPTPSSVSTMSEWEDYNDTLSQVLTWLEQAEAQLKQQEPVSNNVDKVKDQFREHEEFMMILTSHQTSVGSVLEFGSQLINEGIVVGKEERDIKDQMSLLSDKWENLRIAAMQRQSELHQHLMKLQQAQLKELADWLNIAEQTMTKAEPIGCELDTVKRQVDEHKKFQEDLENQQQHVNSLSHMVVVVDESESENATADLEEQLSQLGDRWSAVCKWTEHRWVTLQEILTSWQQYRNEEQRLNDWLYEKEKSLKAISVIDMGDKREVQKQLQKLKDLEEELTQQQSSFGEFNLAAQRVAQTLDDDSPAIQGIQDTMEDFNRRWNTIASMLNTKMKHFRGMENKLQSFLKEIEDNMSWINDTEMLLKPQMNPQRDLVESLDQAVKKRRTSIASLHRQGEELMKQTLSAGQSVVGIQQYLQNFKERWEVLTNVIQDRRQTLEFSEKKKVFIEESQRILIMITEIITYIEKIVIELKHNPKELLIKIEIKSKELTSCKQSLEKLAADSNSITDPALKSAFDIELKTVFQKFETVEEMVKEQQKKAMEIVKSTPPPEFVEKMTTVKVVVDEVFPVVSCEFKYDEIVKMQTLAENLKKKLTSLHDQETMLNMLSKQQKEMLKNLAEDNYQKYQKQLSDLSRQWADCKKITEARLQRVNEAILQTIELETAMNETFNWMDDVDKFLEEITGTISEGDADTIESQVQEVEALQQDIATVQKKVDSLIETCTAIINRAQTEYGTLLSDRLTALRDRWSSVISTTEKQKENLRNAGLKFKEVDAGIKEVIKYLTETESAMHNEKLSSLDKISLKDKFDQYKETEDQMSVKSKIIKEYTEVVDKIIATAPTGTEPPVVSKDLEIAAKKYHSTLTEIHKMLDLLANAVQYFEEFERLLHGMNEPLKVLDNAIKNSSERLKGEDNDLEDCLTTLNELSNQLTQGMVSEIERAGGRLIEMNVCVIVITDMTDDVKSRLENTTERCRKVKDILEGELMKRQQLQKDLVQISDWLLKAENEVAERTNGNTEITGEYIETLTEEISLNEALVSSAKRSITDVLSTKGLEENQLSQRIGGIEGQLKKLIESFEHMKTQPKVVELERKFSSLEGSVLTDIDNLKRKVKKVLLYAPEVNDIQMGLEMLEEHKRACNDVNKEIDNMRSIAEELSSRSKKQGLERQIDEVKDEYSKLQTLIQTKEELLSNALPLSELVYGDMERLNSWLEGTSSELGEIPGGKFPTTPEESIEKIQSIINDIASKAEDVQKLSTNASNLGQLSEEKAFRAMETRVRDVYNVYVELERESHDKLDALRNWQRELDEYERRVDDLNAWIDGRMATLESIGGVSNKFDVEMEQQKLKSIQSLYDAKESELDILKHCGDDISQKGNLSLVEPFEQQIYKRWDELERKIKFVGSTLEMKLKEIEKSEDPPPEKRRIIEEQEEIVINDPIEIVEVESAPPMEDFPEMAMDDSEPSSKLDIADDFTDSILKSLDFNGTSSLTSISSSAMGKMSIKLNSVPKTKKYKGEERVQTEDINPQERYDKLNDALKQIRKEIDSVEVNVDGDFTEHKNKLEDLDQRLNEMQLEFNAILSSDPSNTANYSLSESVMDTYVSYEKYKTSIEESEHKYLRMQYDLDRVQAWVEQAEKVLQGRDQKKILELDENLEKHGAEIEGVNVRAEQLTGVCSDSMIPKKKITPLNRRFKIISKQFEQYKSPEEKVTTYKISVETGDLPECDTKANVSVKLFGEYGNSDQLQLRQSETKRKKFQVNQVDLFTFREQPWLGKLSKLRVWHDNEGPSPAWFLSSIYVLDELSGRLFCFAVDSWLSKEHGAVLKELPVSAMGLSKEASSNIMVKKHQIGCVHWLFDTFSKASAKNKSIKPWEDLIKDVDQAITSMKDLEDKLHSLCFKRKPFDDFEMQDSVLQEIESSIDTMNPSVRYFMMIRDRYLAECSEEDMHEVDVKLATMRTQWNAVNKEFRIRHGSFSQMSVLWDNFHDSFKAMSAFLEELKSKDREMRRDALNRKSAMFALLNDNGQKIISESSEAEAQSIQDKLSLINVQWSNAQNENVDQRTPGGTMDVEHFVKDTPKLNDYHEMMFDTKPHPVDEEALEYYLKKLKEIQQDLPNVEVYLRDLQHDASQLLTRSDLSSTRREEIKSHLQEEQNKLEEIKESIGKRIETVQEKLHRATKFLEELQELSVWMSSTRELLEGQQQGKPGFNVDPETMKRALETRKTNVESINKLLTEFKAEGELTSGHFPQDVGEKIARLNIDWQVIIRLAIALKERPISEEMVIPEFMQVAESGNMDDMFTTHEQFKVNVAVNDYTSTTNFDRKAAQMHDWLKLIEQKMKGISFTVGDNDDMESAIKKQMIEIDNRKSELEDTIEIGAALNMESNDQAQSYAVDDKVSKMKEHWEVVCRKVEELRSNFETVLGDWKRFNQLQLQLDNFIYKSEIYLNENQRIGNTVTLLEDQLERHKSFQEEIVVWSNTYNAVRQLAEKLLQNNADFNLSQFQSQLYEINQRWNNLEQRSNARQQSLQDALDRLLLFHKNMISALTWLSSAESKVAELDSLVEASQTEESTNVQELQKEMRELEEDIASHQSMFQSLNETGNQIMVDLEAGEVRTALQSKLDDMNDRWNSLGVRVVDIRDRMSNGTGEWRQLLYDMQEIVDWLARADQELMSQQPIARDLETIRRQNNQHQEFKSKLKVRHVVIEQALEQGHSFLLKHQSDIYSSRDDNDLVARVTSNLQNQLDHVESQWQELMRNSEKWQSNLSSVLDLADQLLQNIDTLNNRLTEAETQRNYWLPTSDMVVDNINNNLEEVKLFHNRLLDMEPQFDKMGGATKELKHIHNIALAEQTEGIIEQLHERWRQLLSDSEVRQNNLQGLVADNDSDTSNPLQGSVNPPWERGQSVNKVPYFINHDTKSTQWDHPKMTELYHTLSELNDVKFAAYRTSMKLRCIQKACCLDLVDMNTVTTNVFNQHGIRSNSDSLIDVGEMIATLSSIFETVEKARKDAISVPQCVDLTLNWLLNVYDIGRIGKIRVLSFKVGVILLSRAKLVDKWKYLFLQIANNTGYVDAKRLGLLLHDCVQIPRQLGEIAAFGGSNIEPSVRSCFEKAKNSDFIEAGNFIEWTAAEPQSLVWMPVLHRLAAAETAKHEAKCNICKEYPIIGFRYRCLKCFNYDLCQSCFWSGRTSKSHRVTHPMHQYSVQTTTGEDMSDFVKLMKNKFKSRRYRSRPPKKLGYLPVQTIMEGSSIETPSIPTTPDMSFGYDSSLDGSRTTPETSRYNMDDVAEEHRLIQQMCQSLSGDLHNGHDATPKSPSQILASLDIGQKQDISELIRGLEEEHQELEAEYNRLKGIRPSVSDDGSQSGNDSARDAELLAEAKVLRQHKGRLEARMQILEDHNKQLEAQLQRLRQLLEQPSSDRERHNSSHTEGSHVTPALTPSSSYHGSPELARREPPQINGYSSSRAVDIQHVTSQIEHAFPVEE